ncbi:hypothetical protein [Prosthecobacter sp.]|uniref:hypothetical protein n=1 Tax=Prosthecobacter sp. TaxID=1965333 RepID=UPI0037837C56
MTASHHNHTEPAERAPLCHLINHGTCWLEWPAELQQQITRIAENQAKLKELAVDGKNWSDADFTEGVVNIAKVWPSLRTGLYPWPSQTKTRTKWRTLLDELEQRSKTELLRHTTVQSKKLRAASSTQFIKFSEYDAINLAIETARGMVAQRSEERLVVFKARTRGGKTWMGDQLAEEEKINWRVRAMPSWGDSYKAMLISLCAMFNIGHTRRQGADELESLLIAHIKTLSGVVLFEEMQGLCRKSQEFIKTLLNESSLVVCIFVTNEAHDEMLAHGGNHLAQLLARAETTITASKITADHVRRFDEDLWKKAADAKQLGLVAAAANQLGALSAVRRITAMVRALLGKGALITDEMIADAIAGYRRAVPVVSTTTRKRGMQTVEGRAE